MKPAALAHSGLGPFCQQTDSHSLPNRLQKFIRTFAAFNNRPALLP